MTRKSVNRIQIDNEGSQTLVVFGIVSSEPDYKLSVLINQTLGNSLQSTEPVVINYRDKTIEFSRFTDKSDLPHSSLSLIQNRSEKQTLLRKFPNIDYILVRTREAGKRKEADEEYSSRLRGIKHITAVFNIEIGKMEASALEAILPY
jgi:hypothetical protein